MYIGDLSIEYTLFCCYILLFQYKIFYLILSIGTLYFIYKRKYLFSILYGLFVILIVSTLLLPLTLNIDSIHKQPFGINEYFQDKLTEELGIETFYRSAYDSIVQEDENFKWSSFFWSGAVNNMYTGYFRYSKEIFLSKIIISPFQSLEKHCDFTLVKWRPDFIFLSNSKFFEFITRQTFLISYLAILTISILLLLFAGYKKVVIKSVTSFIKSSFIFSLGYLSICSFLLAYIFYPGIYLKPVRIIDKINNEESINMIAKIADNTKITAVTFLPFTFGEKKAFIAKSNFLPSEYVRINIDLFQYLYYADDISFISKSDLMEITQISDKLYLGRYDSYISASNKTSMMFILLLSIQFIAWLVFCTKLLLLKRRQTKLIE